MGTIITEDELLIISDDDLSEDKNVEIKQEGEAKDEIITFGEDEEIEISEDLQIDLSDEKKEVTVEDIFTEENKDKSDNGLDFSFGVDDTKEEKIKEIIEIPEDKEEGKKEEIKEIIETSEDKEEGMDVLDFSFGEEEQSDILELKEDIVEIKEDITEIKEEISFDGPEDNSESLINLKEDTNTFDIVDPIIEDSMSKQQTGDSSQNDDDDDDDDTDINTILEATIKKLSTRDDIIAKIKEETSSKIEELNIEIKSLQTEVKDHKVEIKDFDKESNKIKENIQSLENMKMK